MGLKRTLLVTVVRVGKKSVVVLLVLLDGLMMADVIALNPRIPCVGDGLMADVIAPMPIWMQCDSRASAMQY
jgi:hypothetical protein